LFVDRTVGEAKFMMLHGRAGVGVNFRGGTSRIIGAKAIHPDTFGENRTERLENPSILIKCHLELSENLNDYSIFMARIKKYVQANVQTETAKEESGSGLRFFRTELRRSRAALLQTRFEMPGSDAATA
jgi:hypothetical protein